MDRVLLRITVNEELWNKFNNYAFERETKPGTLLRMFAYQYLDNPVKIKKINLPGKKIQNCFFMNAEPRKKFKMKCVENNLKESEVLTYFIRDYLLNCGIL